MRTAVFQVDPASFRPEELDVPARLLREGGIVAFPTETVYGLGVSAHNPEAVHRLCNLKNRPMEKPFSIHIADLDDVYRFVDGIPKEARILMDLYWPGPLTIIFPGNAGAGIGIRFPRHDLARELIRRAEVPVLAPSANLAGEHPASTAEDVLAVFDGRIDAIVDGGRVAIRQASSVARILEGDVEVLREGIISGDMIRRAVKGKSILFVCTGNSCRSPMAEALLAKLLSERLTVAIEEVALKGFHIHSAGIQAFSGGQASRNAVEVMAERGIDISGHRARPVTRQLAEEADLIIALSPSHRWQLVQWNRDIADKVEVIRELGVTDPIGGTLEEYRMCADEIERELRDRWVDRALAL